MAVRTAYVGTQVAGDVLTAANFTKLPGGWIGDASVTANQTGITTVADLTNLTVAVTAGSSRRLRITAQAIITRTVNDGYVLMSIKEGATVLQQIQIHPVSTDGDTKSGSVTVTPSSGSHTYKLTLERGSGTGTVGIAANASAPAFILVEDIGPSS